MLKRNRLLAWLLLPFVAACTPLRSGGPTLPPPVTASLAEVIASVADSPPLNRTHWGIRIYDPETRETLYDLNPDRLFAPASNNKLLIGAVALAELGVDYRYRTDIFAIGVEPGDSVADRLLVIARGDPTMSGRFLEGRFAALDSLADSVAWAGIRRVRNGLLVDASFFDAVMVNSTWQIGWEGATYAASLAAFGVAEGIMRVRVGPGGAAGELGIVEVLDAPEAVFVHNLLLTGEPGSPNRVQVSGRFSSDSILVTGSIPLGEPPRTLQRAAGNPANFAAHALAATLTARGISLDGGVQVTFSPAHADEVLAGHPRRVAAWTSPPLHEIVHGLMKPSQNWMTEKLAKTLGAERGRQGSWGAGLAVVRTYLYNVAGLDSGSVVLVDGSGLSHQNLITPAALVQLLDHARQQHWGPAFRASLPTPGGTGTLSSRLPGLEGRVFAKTGSIANVNALSGFVITANGRELIFSILTNASGRPAAEVRAGIDRIVAAIAESNIH